MNAPDQITMENKFLLDGWWIPSFSMKPERLGETAKK